MFQGGSAKPSRSQPDEAGLASVPQVVARNAALRPEAPALRARTEAGWRTLTWAQWDRDAARLAKGLAARGIGPGDRIAVFARDSLASATVDLAVAQRGGVVVPLPLGVPAPELAAIVRDADVKLAFVGRDLAVRMLGGSITVPTHEIDDTLETSTALISMIAQGDGSSATARTDVEADAAWSILYTSGTTGAPRGIVLSHRAALYQGRALAAAGALGPADVQLLAVSGAHVFGRMSVQSGVASGMCTAFGSARTLGRDVADVQPVCFSAVPEALEQLAEEWRDRLGDGGPIRGATQHAIEVGRRVSAHRQRGTPIGTALTLQHRVADRLVLAKMRALLGPRLRFVACGGAALRREIVEFFHAFGVLVLEGYGLTEAGGVVAWNRPDSYRFGTVGEVLRGSEVKLLPDGELCVRAPSTGRPSRTDAEGPVVDDEGFLHTGDIAEFDRGFVRLVGRKRDIIKTSGGKLVAPQKLELRLSRSAGIARAVVLGEGQTRLCVLVDIDEDELMDLARREGLGCRSRGDLIAHPRIVSLVGDAIAAVNTTSARHEQLHELALLPEPLDATAGELTAGGSIRRAVVAARWLGPDGGATPGRTGIRLRWFPVRSAHESEAALSSVDAAASSSSHRMRGPTGTFERVPK
jgi:long-chain acyl-CoA synthetase